MPIGSGRFGFGIAIPNPGVQSLNDEPEVLERSKQADVHYQRDQQARRSYFRPVVVFVDYAAGGVVDESRQYHHQDVYRLAPCVEHKSAYQYDDVLGFLRHEVVQYQRYRKKRKQKC